MPDNEVCDWAWKSMVAIDSDLCSSPYSTDVRTALRPTERRIHRFSISHSQTKDSAVGFFFNSPAFTVGAHSWAVRYCPREKESIGIGLYLSKELGSGNAVAVFALTLVDRLGGAAASKVFSYHFSSAHNVFGCDQFATRFLVEACVKGDDLIFDCDLTLCEIADAKNACNRAIELHPKVDPQFWGKGMEDVSFLVEGEIIAAHRLVLAASSPVFKSMFYGPMKGSQLVCIPIMDIEASIFKAMLHYIYTNSLPENIVPKGGSIIHVLRLLEASNKYAIYRLKLVCEQILGKDIHTDTLAATRTSPEKCSLNHLEVLRRKVLVELQEKITKFPIFQFIVDKMSRTSHSQSSHKF